MSSDPHVDHDVTRRTVMAAVRDLDGPTVRDALLQSLLTCRGRRHRHRGGDAGAARRGRRLGARRPRCAPRALRLQHLPRGARRAADAGAGRPAAHGRARLPAARAARPAAGAVRRDAARPLVARGQPRRQHPDGRHRRGRALPGGRRVRARRGAPFGLRVPDARRCRRLAERVPLFLAGEGALALPSPPAGATVLPRDLRVAAERGRRHRAPRGVHCVSATTATSPRSADPAYGGAMRITHLGHACLLVEMADTRLLIDPGTFADDLSDVRDLSAVLVTHQHPDHLDPERLPALVAANPGRGRALRPGQRRRARRARGRRARPRRLGHHGRRRHRDAVRPSSTPSSTTTSRASPTSGCASTPRASRRSSTPATPSTPSPVTSTCWRSRSRRRGSAAGT